MAQMRELTLALAQNGTGAGTIAEILDADNFARIKQLANEVENKQEALQGQMQKAQAEAAQNQLAMEAQEEQAKRDHEATQKELDRANKVEVALINASAKDTDHDNDGKTDS